MKPTVILIQPLTNIFDRGKKMPTLPLSLLSAAREMADRYDLRVVDLRADPHWRETLAHGLDEHPLCVATTSVTGNQIFSALEVIRFVRSESDAPIVWGGIHGTLFPDQVLKEPSVDYVVRGEGEKTFLELADRLAGGEGVDGIDGLSTRKDRGAHHAPDRPFIDLDRASEIPYEVLDGPPYFLTGGRETLYLETSRGCFSRCAYCYNATFHRRQWRAQSADTVVHRIVGIRRRHGRIAHISFVDDNYFGDVSRALAIAEGLLEKEVGITYQIQGAHIQILSRMSEADLRRLRRSGCTRLDMGVESGSEAILGAMHKKLDFPRILHLNRTLLRLGITPWYNFMAGFPDETDADVDATRRLIFQLLDENPGALISPIYQVAPYPGTELFERARAMGFSPPDTLEAWRDYHSGGAKIPWRTTAESVRLGKLYFLSIFIDTKLTLYDTHPAYRLLARLYRPIARFRLRRNILAFMPEYGLFRRLFDIS